MMMEYENEYEQLKSEYEQLKKSLQGYEKGIQQAYLDPETREPLKKILSKHAGVEIDDPPQEKMIKEELDKVHKKIEKLETEKFEMSRKEQQQQLKKYIDEYGITHDDLDELKKFISQTGIMPTSLEGWKTVIQNFQRSRISKPTYVLPFKDKFLSNEDFMKNPKGAFYKAHLEAMKK